MALNDSVFTPSSPAHHSTEMSGIMKDTEKPILKLYSDWGHTKELTMFPCSCFSMEEG